jgi:hypothetical protein
MGLRLIRRHRTRLPDALGFEPGRMQEESFTLLRGHWVAKAPLIALVRTLLGRQQLLESRKVVCGHVEVNHAPCDAPSPGRGAPRADPDDADAACAVLPRSDHCELQLSLAAQFDTAPSSCCSA